MSNSKDTTRELTDDALFAFWQVIAARFPEAESGDLSPWQTVKLQSVAEDAVKQWIYYNVPSVTQ